MSSSQKTAPINNNNSRKRRRGKRGKRGSTKTKRVAFAIATTSKSFLRTLKSPNNGREMILEGADLIVPAPAMMTTNNRYTQVFLNMPANPLYWVGTRISGIASVYQNYRPLKFEVEYVPQVPVTVPGQVTMGTLWNATTPEANVQQSLLTSNGGRMVQCYQKARSRVLCNEKTLPLKLYNVKNSLDLNTSCPFIWVAHYTGGTVNLSTPGYIYVHWKYLFSDPIGNTGEQTIALTQTDDETAAQTNALPGWGVVLGILKKGVVPILKRISILLLDEVRSSLVGVNGTIDGVVLNPAGMYSYDLESLHRNDEYSTIKDSQGNTYQISDDSRVAIYANGPVIKDTTPTEVDYELVALTNDTGPNRKKQKVTEHDYQIMFFNDAGATIGVVGVMFNADLTNVMLSFLITQCKIWAYVPSLKDNAMIQEYRTGDTAGNHTIEFHNFKLTQFYDWINSLPDT